MDFDLIKKLVKLVDSSGVTDLEIEENGSKIKIAKKVRTANVLSAPAVLPHQQAAQTQTQQAKSSEDKPAAKEDKSEKLYEIKSPIVGTFYRAPAPDADPYINVGDRISTGAVLCIVEAMKLMNEIESEVNGTVVKILVDNGKPVEYNQPLFLVKVD